ncbi:hypothetical protein H2248_012381 [Termitomyces sp. 'cryptogamus']|nr:hypothetical protein H2248_012381 [Termitomyces sp. 'cryptogamus']
MPIKKIVGPKSNHDSPAGLDTRTRDGPFAQLIAQQIVNGNVSDPNHYLLKDCLGWSNASDDDWLEPPVKKVINGHQDAFSVSARRNPQWRSRICPIQFTEGGNRVERQVPWSRCI